MGCHLPKSKQQNIKVLKGQKNVLSQINYDHEYIQYCHGIEIEQAHIFSINKQTYILLIQLYSSERLQIYNIQSNKQVDCELQNVEDLKFAITNQFFLFLQARKYLFQLSLVNQKFVIKKRYINISKKLNIKILFINEYQDLILELKKRVIRVKSLKLQKQIFKIQKNEQSNMTYHNKNGNIIYLEEPNIGYQFINILNINNRYTIIQQLKQMVIQMVVIQNTDDILMQIRNKGLFLYRVNYQDKKIDRILLLNYNVEQICIFDEKNLLNLITQMFFIRFDKQYKIIQKYKINYNYDSNDCNEQLLPSLSNVQFKNNLPELLSFQKNHSLPLYQVYKLKQMSRDQETDIYFSQCLNYQTDYQYYTGTLQHLISPDQRYLTYIIGLQLVFHVVSIGLNKQIYFEQKINYLSFSKNSNYLYIALDQVIYSYKTVQNMKKCSQLHYQVNKLETKQVGFLITINNNQIIAISKQSRKLIFKLSTIKQQSFDYQSQNGIILVSNNDQVSLYILSDRKLISNHNIRNKQCKIIQGTRNFIILNDDEQLQLWSYNEGYPILEKIIMDKVRIILQGYLEFQCFKTLNQILIMDKNFQVVEQIDYNTQKRDQGPRFDSDAINEDDQIIQENFIIRLKYYQSIDKYYGGNQENFILSLESRQ